MPSIPTLLPGKWAESALKFGLVGLSGLLVNQLAFALFIQIGVFYLIAAIAATQVSSTSNFLGSEYWVFSGRLTRGNRLGRYAAFLALNNASLLLRVPMLWLLADVLGLHPLVANPITLVVLWAVRFTFADGWIWRATAPALNANGPAGGEESGNRRARLVALGPGAMYEYDIAGVLRVQSQVRLPELSYFLTDLASPPDIRINVMRVGGLSSRRTRFVSAGTTIGYYEHLGLAGANFRITMGEPVVVEVAPLLARSPHVLYTNVIEALLRFLLVSRGYVLLHSACIAMNGRATLLSAQTDTGKTSTVIELVRDHGFEFLSDDMTILAPDGRAICYPKPMTLSFHTMGSIRGDELRRRERAALAVQSRLHSKSGRSVGRFLGSLNIPIMSINSVVQILVPPPKYRIDALMPAAIGREARITHAVLMERGEPIRERVSLEEGVEALIANTDDAYGFPPFATFAPHIRIGTDDYAALRVKEEALIRRALAQAALFRIRVVGHEWAQILPTMLDGDEGTEGPASLDVSRLIPLPIQAAEEVDGRPVRSGS